MPDDWKIGNLEDVIKFYNGYAFKSKELLNKQKKVVMQYLNKDT
ncbi:hypothetical protein [Treponema putidum]|nr:hypothetical protein [Treponema putidum]